MFTESARYYDLIYAWKDYTAEARDVATRLRALEPRCESVLDVACGTGEHARWLAADGFRADGLDIDPAFVEIARRKHTRGRFFTEDMSAFRLPHRYDAVICMFSSIGYLTTLPRVKAALRCFREHLEPGGIVIVEPWFEPSVLDPTRTFQHVGEGDGIRVVRSGRFEIIGHLSRLYFTYEITDAHGTRTATEAHDLALYTREELLGAFRNAGLDADFHTGGPMGRGLYVARSRKDGSR
jgi:SAM-dependent methyltransferase